MPDTLWAGAWDHAKGASGFALHAWIVERLPHLSRRQPHCARMGWIDEEAVRGDAGSAILCRCA